MQEAYSLPEPKREYLRGVYYEMAGAGRNHEIICANIYERCIGRIRSKGCRVFTSGLRLSLPDESGYFYPDLIVECPPGTADYVESPTMIVEVLSSSTRLYDTTVKKPIYLGMPSLRHLLFIDPYQVSIEHYFRSEPTPVWQYEWLSALADNLHLPLWNIQLPVEAIYEDVNLNR
jgi:Uma2 family endonuclease